jgi:hypothetical protein
MQGGFKRFLPPILPHFYPHPTLPHTHPHPHTHLALSSLALSFWCPCHSAPPTLFVGGGCELPLHSTVQKTSTPVPSMWPSARIPSRSAFALFVAAICTASLLEGDNFRADPDALADYYDKNTLGQLGDRAHPPYRRGKRQWEKELGFKLRSEVKSRGFHDDEAVPPGVSAWGLLLLRHYRSGRPWRRRRPRPAPGPPSTGFGWHPNEGH